MDSTERLDAGGRIGIDAPDCDHHQLAECENRVVMVGTFRPEQQCRRARPAGRGGRCQSQR
jgi:hypothetical protein